MLMKGPDPAVSVADNAAAEKGSCIVDAVFVVSDIGVLFLFSCGREP